MTSGSGTQYSFPLYFAALNFIFINKSMLIRYKAYNLELKKDLDIISFFIIKVKPRKAKEQYKNSNCD